MRGGKVAGKQQLEELVRSAACGIDAFYAMRTPVPCTAEVWRSAEQPGFHPAEPATHHQAGVPF